MSDIQAQERLAGCRTDTGATDAGRVSGHLAEASDKQSGDRDNGPKELIEHLQRVDAESPRPVTGADLDELYEKGKGPSNRQFQRMFGSLAKSRRWQR